MIMDTEHAVFLCLVFILLQNLFELFGYINNYLFLCTRNKMVPIEVPSLL